MKHCEKAKAALATCETRIAWEKEHYDGTPPRSAVRPHRVELARFLSKHMAKCKMCSY